MIVIQLGKLADLSVRLHSTDCLALSGNTFALKAANEPAIPALFPPVYCPSVIVILVGWAYLITILIGSLLLETGWPVASLPTLVATATIS